MNPGQLNHRVKFSQLNGNTQNEFGGSTPTEKVILTTWGRLEPIKQYNQWANEAGASYLNGDKMLVIRYRSGFTPTKDMIFEDLNNPGDTYTVRSVSPFWPGVKQAFESQQSTVYKDNVYVFILGIKRT